MLFKINAAKGTYLKETYLFGTFHMALEDVRTSLAPVINIVNLVDTVYLERDKSRDEKIGLDPVAGPKLNRISNLPKGKTLESVLSSSEIANVSRALGEEETKIRCCSKAPFLIAESIGKIASLEDNQSTTSLDEVIFNEASKLVKAKGLEEIEDMYQHCFGPLDIEMQKQLLNEALKENWPQIHKDFTQAYFANDYHKCWSIETECNTSLSEITCDWKRDYLKRRLDDRNTLWMDKLKPIIGQKSLLIAVGVCHLYGHNGLIEMLEKEGYEVKPCESKPATGEGGTTLFNNWVRTENPI